MKKRVFFLVLISIIFLGCDLKDCPNCFTPPQAFLFEIVDKSNGENLFTNGTFVSEEITIENEFNNNFVEFTFISEDNINLIQIASIGWKTEIVNLKIVVSDQHIFNLFVDAERKMGDCCSFTEYNEISLSQSDYIQDSQSGVYKILVD